MRLGVTRKKSAAGGMHKRMPPDLHALVKLLDGRRYDQIEEAARQLLSRRPGELLAKKVLGYALVGLGRYEEALPVLKALAVKLPHDHEIHNNLGIALSALLEFDASIGAFRTALALQPKDHEIFYNLGAAYVHQNRWDDAIPWLLQAIELHPGDYIEAIGLLASSLINLNRVEEAKTCFRELWQANPENSFALFQLLFCYLRSCDWERLVEDANELIHRLPSLEQTLGPPFPALAMNQIGAAEQRKIAELHANTAVTPYVYAHGSDWQAPNSRAAGRRLKVGYLSADLRFHPVGFAIPALIEQHRREKIEVFAYSSGIDDGSEIRQRLMRAFDHFVDIKELSIPDAVQRIRSDEIDVLVDLQGWTTNCRPELLALRCAPVQVGWLGYAGTMGNKRLADYIIGDSWVTPREHADYYAEAIAQMPNCYLPFDTTRLVASPPTRSAQQLPDDAFVFCSLNNNYKFNPGVFDIWAELLRALPDSILWLSRPGETAADNLKREISRRGIDAGRLIFATRVDSSAEHLARMQLADLALDTFPYNSHSSGSEVLWAGVPMVSLLGETFAGRVGASLLHAAGLPELVTHTTDQYLQLAISLAKNPGRLAAFRSRLKDAKGTASWGNIGVFACALEDLYAQMYAHYEQGKFAPLYLGGQG